MKRVRAILHNRHFWLVLLAMAGVSFIHYFDIIPCMAEPLELISYPLKRHTIQRYLFILPTIYATLAFGMPGEIASLLVSLLVMLPRALFISAYPIDASLETVVVVGVAATISWVVHSLERTRIQYQKAIRRLEAIRTVSETLGHSFELEDALDHVLGKVLEITLSDAGLLFVLDESKQELRLAAHAGISLPVAGGTDGLRIKVGEGLYGQVALTGEPLLVTDVSKALKAPQENISWEGFHAALIVPLNAKGRLQGIMTLVRRDPGEFGPEEVALVTALGNYIGVTIENAQLYRNLRFYIGQITQAQEEERKRIARELHDETIQALLVLRRQLVNLRNSTEPLPEPATQRLQQALQLSDEILGGLRRFIQDLRPPMIDDLGLLPALEILVANLQAHMNIPVRLEVVGEARRLSPEAELVLFRVAQEALSNVHKHAEAFEVVTTVEFAERWVRLTVQDNGRGFLVPKRVSDLAASGKLGLIGMYERIRLLNGSLMIRSDIGQGTLVCAEIPT